MTGEPTGFAFEVVGLDPSGPRPRARHAMVDGRQPGHRHARRGGRAAPRWAATRSTRSGSTSRLEAGKPPALHDEDGWIDFGPAGGSYYYSRTAMDATGTVRLGDATLEVTGDAWFDHQWGDFISVGGGGWDWFAVNLDDGTDLTLSLVRAADGSYPLVVRHARRGLRCDPPPAGRRIHGRGHRRHLDQPRDRRDLPGRLAV